MIIKGVSRYMYKLGCQTAKMAHVRKSKPEIYSVLGVSKIVFTCPSAIIYKFYMPGAKGQAPMLSPEQGLSQDPPCLSFGQVVS